MIEKEIRENASKEEGENKTWYVVYTRPRWEKKVAQNLAEKRIEHYCPLNKVTRQWSDRRKVVVEPLFKGYVFVKIEEGKKWEVPVVNGVLNYVYWVGKPAKVREEEIQTIRKFLKEFDNVEVSKGTLEVNQQVRITQGLLMNHEGMVLSVYGSKAVVRIESMDVMLSAHFDRKDLDVVR